MIQGCTQTTTDCLLNIILAILSYFYHFWKGGCIFCGVGVEGNSFPFLLTLPGFTNLPDSRCIVKHVSGCCVNVHVSYVSVCARVALECARTAGSLPAKVSLWVAENMQRAGCRVPWDRETALRPPYSEVPPPL